MQIGVNPDSPARASCESAGATVPKTIAPAASHAKRRLVRGRGSIESL